MICNLFTFRNPLKSIMVWLRIYYSNPLFQLEHNILCSRFQSQRQFFFVITIFIYKTIQCDCKHFYFIKEVIIIDLCSKIFMFYFFAILQTINSFIRVKNWHLHVHSGFFFIFRRNSHQEIQVKQKYRFSVMM